MVGPAVKRLYCFKFTKLGQHEIRFNTIYLYIDSMISSVGIVINELGVICRGAKGAEVSSRQRRRGGGVGQGTHSRLKDLGERRELPAGSGAEPWKLQPFYHIFANFFIKINENSPLPQWKAVLVKRIL